MFGTIGNKEIIVIGIIVLFMIWWFGKKAPSAARSAGKSLSEFKKGLSDIPKEFKEGVSDGKKEIRDIESQLREN